jgi:hypothetical protein
LHATEPDALPAWAALAGQERQGGSAQGQTQAQGSAPGTDCLLIATPNHVLLLARASNKPLYAAAMCDLVHEVGVVAQIPHDAGAMLAHVAAAWGKGGVTLLLGDCDKPKVYILPQLYMPQGSTETLFPWLHAQLHLDDSSRDAQMSQGAAEAAADPTLGPQSWLPAGIQEHHFACCA